MKYQITKDEFEKLSEDLQKEYTLDGENATLKIEGDNAPSADAVEAAKRAEEKLRIEKEHRKNAETARDAAEARSEKLREDLDKASGKEEISKIKQEHQDELEKLRNEREQEKTAAKEARNKSLIEETARKFASDHFTIPDLMEGQFAKRLSVEEVNGEPVVRVLGPDGKPSVLGVDELKKEFLDNTDYSTIIKAKTGSGGGANNGGGGGASQKSLSEMTATEESEFANKNPEAYEKMIDES